MFVSSNGNIIDNDWENVSGLNGCSTNVWSDLMNSIDYIPHILMCSNNSLQNMYHQDIFQEHQNESPLAHLCSKYTTRWWWWKLNRQ